MLTWNAPLAMTALGCGAGLGSLAIVLVLTACIPVGWVGAGHGGASAVWLLEEERVRQREEAAGRLPRREVAGGAPRPTEEQPLLGGAEKHQEASLEEGFMRKTPPQLPPLQLPPQLPLLQLPPQLPQPAVPQKQPSAHKPQVLPQRPQEPPHLPEQQPPAAPLSSKKPQSPQLTAPRVAAAAEP